MLTVVVEEQELYDNSLNSFIQIPRTELRLEHSLISLSRWESKWKKPFLNDNEHTQEEVFDYICCMSLDKNVDPEVIPYLTTKQYKDILDYISDEHTATKIYDRRPPRAGGRHETLTSELIYYYMIFYGIPMACEKWHLNRLMTLIKVCGVKGGTTNQAMDLNSIFSQNKALNAARRRGK